MSAAETTPELDGIALWTVELMETLGAPGAGLAIFVENLFPPIPSEVVLPMAGFAARLGDLSLAGAIIWTTIGSVAGSWVLYGLGAWLGHERMRAIGARIPLVDVEDIDRTTAWFAKHGTKAVFFGRMVPLFRSFISIPAGTERMSLPVFTVLTAAGSLIWNSIFVVAGYLLGANWHAVDPYASVLQYIVIATVAVGLVWFLVGRIRRRRAQRLVAQQVAATRGD